MKISVLIITKHKDVIFGRITEEDKQKSIVCVDGARLCFPLNTDDVIKMASYGPSESSRYVSPLPRAIVRDVEVIIECSPEAVAAFEKRNPTDVLK